MRPAPPRSWRPPTGNQSIAADPIPIRMGGYGPPTTGFSRALKLIGDRLAAEFGDRSTSSTSGTSWISATAPRTSSGWSSTGVLTLGYQSSSYLTDRVPELGFVDLPFLFADNATRRARAMDGALGRLSRQAIESASTTASSAGSRTASATSPTGCARCARRPTSRACASACCRARSRRAPSSCSARSPLSMDLTEAMRCIKAGKIDAQENPLANTVTYGVHKFHRFHT